VNEIRLIHPAGPEAVITALRMREAQAAKEKPGTLGALTHIC